MTTTSSPERPAIRLFDLPGLPANEPEPEVETLSYARRLTLANQRVIDSGFHPATAKPLAGNGATCGNCVHRYPTGRNVKTFWKCAKAFRKPTRGPRTDIRLKWPACSLFEGDVPWNERTSVPTVSSEEP